MIWLAALLVTVVALEILRKQRTFALAMTFAIVGFAATLNLLNVDVFIVQKNVERSVDGTELDYAYLATLSDDAIPALAEALDEALASSVTHDLLAVSLICHWYQNESRLKEIHPWQSFHLSHWAASQIYSAINPLEGYTVTNDDWYWQVTAPSGREYDCSDRFTFD